MKNNVDQMLRDVGYTPKKDIVESDKKISNTINPDYIFECKKCGHLVYATSTDKLLDYSCPHCGEEWSKNWIFIGKGDWKKNHGE